MDLYLSSDAIAYIGWTMFGVGLLVSAVLLIHKGMDKL